MRNEFLTRKLSNLFFLPILVIALGFGGIFFVPQFRLTYLTVAAINNDSLTLIPEIIPFSDPEIMTAQRGLYMNNGSELAKLPTVAQDSYRRYTWNQFETSQGTYNWTEIDNHIQTAISLGQKFAFRIQAMKSNHSGVSYLPSYLTNDQSGKWVNGTFLPDWNNEFFLNRSQQLLVALGDHLRAKGYENQISWIDIGIFGQYGEWYVDKSLYPSSCDSSRPGQTDCFASDANLKRVIDMHRLAFPNTRLLIQAGTYPDPVIYAMDLSDQIGWRDDCLGTPGYYNFETNSNYTQMWSILKNRWQTAPVVMEYCSSGIYLDHADPNQDDGARQIAYYHTSSIGNHNVTFDTENTIDKFLNNAKHAGYRYQIKSIMIPWLAPNDGSSFDIVSSWENVGNAPTYEPWQITYRLINIDNQVIWEGNSSLNLQKLLPTTTGQTQTDSFKLSTVVPAGSYSLQLIITDSRAAAKRFPMGLAIKGRAADGSYFLGKITVGNPVMTPTIGATPIPTATPVPTVVPTATPVPVNSGPVITVISPKDNATIFRSVWIGAKVSDPDGIYQTKFWFDNVLVKTCHKNETNCNYTYKANFTTGNHAILIESFDNSSNRNRSQVIITVKK
ncbi:MAG TPA: hypothetical protein DEP87_04770 [Candidatus Pacebacteria bacterium]|nr:hypothetical protein [Candidatus Paceibacterota bacterium]